MKIIKVCIQLDESSIDICPNRILVSSKLICPYTYKPTQPDITPHTQPIITKYPFQYAVQVIWSKI